jgi:hypothetical protein
MTEYNPGWKHIGSAPTYIFTCDCGLVISGNSEKGLAALYNRHKEEGYFHNLKENK